MTDLSEWLEAQSEERTGVGPATVRDTLTQDPMPRAGILFRMTDALGTNPIEILFTAGLLPWGDGKRRPICARTTS